jgi:hypothetical protein
MNNASHISLATGISSAFGLNAYNRHYRVSALFLFLNWLPECYVYFYADAICNGNSPMTMLQHCHRLLELHIH